MTWKSSEWAVWMWLASLSAVDLQQKYLLAKAKGSSGWPTPLRGVPFEEGIHMPLLATCRLPPTPLPTGGFLFFFDHRNLLVPTSAELSLSEWTRVQDQAPPLWDEELRLWVHPALAAPLRHLVQHVRPLLLAEPTKGWWLGGHGLGGVFAQGVAITLADEVAGAIQGVQTMGTPRWTTVQTREICRASAIPLREWIYRTDPLPHTSTRDVYVHVAPLSWIYGSENQPQCFEHSPDAADHVWFKLLCLSHSNRSPIVDHAIESYFRAFGSIEHAAAATASG